MGFYSVAPRNHHSCDTGTPLPYIAISQGFPSDGDRRGTRPACGTPPGCSFLWAPVFVCVVSRDVIYTYTGPILLAVNPFKSLPSLYTPETLALYRQVDTPPFPLPHPSPPNLQPHLGKAVDSTPPLQPHPLSSCDSAPPRFFSSLPLPPFSPTGGYGQCGPCEWHLSRVVCPESAHLCRGRRRLSRHDPPHLHTAGRRQPVHPRQWGERRR